MGVVLLVLAGDIGGARTSSAQPTPDAEPRYTMALVDVPLSVALEKIIDRTELSLAYDPEMISGRTTLCKAEEAAPEELLSCVLKTTGLDYVQLSSGTYTLRPDARTQPLYAELSGRVIDANTGRPLSGTNVLLKEAGKGAATNSNGRFSVARLKPGRHRVVVTRVGYHNEVDTLHVHPNETHQVALTLSPRTVRAEPVVIDGFEAELPSTALAADTRMAPELQSSPQVGTPDVVRGLNSVAGVRLGDALSEVHLQGGAAGEQQFRLDGAPVFVPVASGGLISPFSPFALNQVTIRKAGFGAEHGSALSGVIELDQRVAPSEEHRLMGRVDPLSVHGQWGGQFGGADGWSGSWMLTGRHDLWSVYQPDALQSLFSNWSAPDRFLLGALRPADQSTDGRAAAPDRTADGPSDPFTVGFTDLHGAARLAFGDLSSLRLSFYRSTNTFGTESVVGPGGRFLFEELEDGEGELFDGTDDADEDDSLKEGEASEVGSVFTEAYRWRNRTGQIRYEWVPSGQLFLSARVWGSDYQLNRPISLSQASPASNSTSEAADKSISVRSKEFNTIREVGARLRADLATTDGHNLSGAIGGTQTQSDVALSVDPLGASPTRPAQIRPTRCRVAGFLDNRIALGKHINLTLGTRLTYLPETHALYGEPRLSLRYDYTTTDGERWAARWAAGRYRQYVHAFDVTTYTVTSLFPRVRYWLPIGTEQRPPESYHTTASVLYRPSNTWTLSTEAYYKHQPHLLMLDYGNEPPDATSSLFQSADGYAYGAAATVTRDSEHFRAKAQYEYSITRRRRPDRFGGMFQPASWSAPHRVHLSVDLSLLSGWTATVRWQGVWGRSWGFRQAYYDFLAPTSDTGHFSSYDLARPAAHHLPPTSRWDLGIAYEREVAGIHLKGRVTVTNLFDRDNVAGWSLQYDPDKKKHVRDQRLESPITPSVSLRVAY